MVQFDFFELALVFGTFLMTLIEERGSWERWIFLSAAFIILCGALVFGLYLQRAFSRLLIFNVVSLFHMALLLLMFSLLWKLKKIKEYVPVLLLIVFFTFFPFLVVTHKGVYVLAFLALLYFLWRNRKLEPRFLNLVVLTVGLLAAIFSFVLPVTTVIYQLPAFHFTILGILTIAGFLSAVIFYFGLYFMVISFIF